MSNDTILEVEIQPRDEVQLADDISPASKEMDKWVEDIEGRLENQDISHATRPSIGSKIKERPSIFGNWKCWDDFGASFIPETEKWQFVAWMTHYCSLNVRSCLEYMQEKEELAWSYYCGVDEKFRAENSKCFIEHLLVYSCFLIFAMVLISWKKDRRKKVLKDKLDEILDKSIVNFILENPARVQTYMLTMNYQIPWFVLEAVYTDLSNIGKIFDTPIHKIALSCFPTYPRVHTSKVNGGTIPEGGIKHLLHIFHWSRTTDAKYMQLCQTKSITSFHIPSAANLQLSQVVFKKDEGGSIDVSYSDSRRLSGVMQLTPWHLYQDNSKVYESLLRFEEYYGECGRPFMAYVACMACLLKTEADIRVLRENGVIPRTSLDDKDVLRCVQELKTFIHKNLYMPNELVILEEKVMAHYERSAYKMYGHFKNRYCTNPWISISVIAAILLFVLTFIQTVLSFIQTKYSVLSYNKQ